VLELFGGRSPSAYWHSLIDGYALDAALAGGQTPPPKPRQVLHSAAPARPFERPGLSLGDGTQAGTDLVLTGISWGGQLLHTSSASQPPPVAEPVDLDVRWPVIRSACPY
jgi:hypothetical protein